MSNPYQSGPARQPVNGWGIAGFVTSIIGLFTCGLLNIISLPLSLIGLCFKPRGFAVAGTVVSLAGTALFGLIGYALIAAFIWGKEVVSEAGKSFETAVALGEASNRIEQYRAQHKTIPDGIEGNKLILDKKDAWEQSLRYDVSDNTYVIRSAGPDKQFDTGDDIKSNEHQADTSIDFGEGVPTEGPVVIPPDTTTTPPDGAATPEAPPGESTSKTDSEDEPE